MKNKRQHPAIAAANGWLRLIVSDNLLVSTWLKKVKLDNIEFNRGLERLANIKAEINAAIENHDQKALKNIYVEVQKWKKQFQNELKYISPAVAFFNKFEVATKALQEEDYLLTKTVLDQLDKKIQELDCKDNLSTVDEGRLKVFRNVRSSITQVRPLNKVSVENGIDVVKAMAKKDKQLMKDLNVLMQVRQIRQANVGVSNKLTLVHGSGLADNDAKQLQNNPELKQLNTTFKALENIEWMQTIPQALKVSFKEEPTIIPAQQRKKRLNAGANCTLFAPKDKPVSQGTAVKEPEVVLAPSI